jgi:hypothetical protein
MRSLAIDYERREIQVEPAAGNPVTAPLESTATPEFIARASYAVPADEVTLVFRGGDQVTLEVGAQPREMRRPIVYLDQNHWVSLAQSRYAPEKLRVQEREAAAALSRLAASGEVILPLSGAHAVETARSDGRWRHNVAMTMLRLSRGWQMLSPVKARGLELSDDMAGRARNRERRAAVFTLEPNALFTTVDKPVDPSDLPPAARALVRRLTWASAFAETLLENEITDEPRGRELTAKWARVHGELAAFMRAERIPREDARLNARAAVLADLQQEIAGAASRAALSQPEFERWLESVRTDMHRLPYVGRLEELLYHRLRDGSGRWEPNDLNDVQFLCCAAGYADVVACEKKTADHLQRAARRADPAAVVCNSLADAWAALQRRWPVLSSSSSE